MNPKKLVMFATESFDRLSAAGWIPAILMRLFVGYFFMETGWGKIHNLDAFATRFAQWGIPHPAFNAALSAYTEFLGGALTILGLGMRFVSIPMIINMIVAILTVKLKNVSGLDDFAELDEPLYALSFVWLFFSGAGWLSVDGLFKQALSSWIRPERSQATVGALPTRCVEVRSDEDRRVRDDANGIRDFWRLHLFFDLVLNLFLERKSFRCQKRTTIPSVAPTARIQNRSRQERWPELR